MEVQRTRHHAFATLACFVLAWSSTGVAQSPAALAQPDLALLTNGSVAVIARQADGGLLLGGGFTSIDGVARSNLARLRPDGSLDPDWNPAPNGAIQAIAISSAGEVFLGGDFTTIGGQSRMRLAKLAAGSAGTVDAQWDPAPNAGVNALVMAGEALYVGGRFTTIGGLPRARLARISGGAGLVDPDWNPAADGTVAAIAVESASAVYVGGTFSTVGGAARANIAKLVGNGIVDPAWNPTADSSVNVLLLDGNGALYAGGGFGQIGSTKRSFVARLATAGTGMVDPVWNPAPSGTVFAMAVDGNQLILGGWFNFVGPNWVRNLARISTTGTGAALPGWVPFPDNIVRAVAVDGSGDVVAGGQFAAVDGSMHLGFARVSSEGDTLQSVDVEYPGGQVTAIAEQPDGSKIIGGSFAKVGQQMRRNLLRLDAAGRLDLDWAPNPDGVVNALAAIGDRVYVAGAFETIGGRLRFGLARIEGAGSGQADPSFTIGVAGNIRAFARDGEALFVGGNFSELDGMARNGLAKIDIAAGAVDPDWDVDTNGSVLTLAADHEGALFAAGTFSVIGGLDRSGLAKISTTGIGTVDTQWNPGPNNAVESLALGADGQLVAGGVFTNIGGQPRARIARLSRSGAGVIDAGWNPSANSGVYALAASPNGAIYAGGTFTSIGGSPRRYLARLSEEGAGTADPLWNPSPNAGIGALLMSHEGILVVGGAYSRIGNQPRLSVGGLAPSGISIALESDRRHVRVGQVLVHTVSVSNLGDQPASAVALGTALSPSLDPASITWQCSASPGSSCGSSGNSGSGALPASIDIAAMGDVVFVLAGTVRSAPAEKIRLDVNALYRDEEVRAFDESFVVLFRTGFESGSDGADEFAHPAPTYD